jgi:nucleoside-diphosphate-sugar epimerase
VNENGIVLVTGGSGVVGSRLLGALADHGWRRRCLVHRRPVLDVEETRIGDVTDPSSLQNAVHGTTAVVHLAALTHSRSPSRYEDVNVRGTQNLVEAAKAAGTRRFLFISTRAISPTGGSYSRSKLRAEEAVRASGLDWTVIRLPEIYGVGGAEGVDRIIALARDGGRIPVVGRGDDLLCPAHVDDVVPACVRALMAAEAVRRTYTLAGSCITVHDFARAAGEVFGRPARIVCVPVPAVAALATLSRVFPLPMYPDQLRRLRSPKPPASPEARIDLRFQPRPLREGLALIATKAG